MDIPVGFPVIAQFNQGPTFKKPQYGVGSTLIGQVIFFTLNHQPGMQVAVIAQIGRQPNFDGLFK